MSSLKKYGIFLASGLGIYSLLVLTILINGLITNPVTRSSQAKSLSTKYKNLFLAKTSTLDQPQTQPDTSRSACLTGMKQLQFGDCGNGGAPVYNTSSGGSGGGDETSVGGGSGGSSTVSKSSMTVTMSITGVVCQDDVVIPFSPFEGCQTMTKDEWASQLSPLQSQMQSLCAGHKSAACSAGSAGGVLPPITIAPSLPVPASKNTSAPSTTSLSKTTAAGSTSPSVQSFGSTGGTCETKSKGDANCDGLIDLVDFRIWVTEYSSGSGTSSDFNGDGVVSFADFSILRDTYVL